MLADGEPAYINIQKVSTLYCSLINIRGCPRGDAVVGGVCYILLSCIALAGTPWVSDPESGNFNTWSVSGALLKTKWLSKILQEQGRLGLFNRVYQRAEEVIVAARKLGQISIGGVPVFFGEDLVLPSGILVSANVWVRNSPLAGVTIAQLAEAGIPPLGAFLIGNVYFGDQWNNSAITPADSTYRDACRYWTDHLNVRKGRQQAFAPSQRQFAREFIDLFQAIFPGCGNSWDVFAFRSRCDTRYVDCLIKSVYADDVAKAEVTLWRNYAAHFLHLFKALSAAAQAAPISSPDLFDRVKMLARSMRVSDAHQLSPPVLYEAVDTKLQKVYPGLMSRLLKTTSNFSSFVDAFVPEVTKDRSSGTEDVGEGTLTGLAIADDRKDSICFSEPWLRLQSALVPWLRAHEAGSNKAYEIMGTVAKSKSQLGLQILFGVRNRTTISSDVSALAAYFHPKPPTGVTRAAALMYKPNLTEYAARTILTGPGITLVTSNWARLISARAPDWFMLPFLSCSLIDPRFNFLTLHLYVKAVGDLKNADQVQHVHFANFMFDAFATQTFSEVGHRFTKQWGWSYESNGVGYTWEEFIGFLVDAVKGLRDLEGNDKLEAARVKLIRECFVEGMRAAQTHMATFLSAIPADILTDFGPFIPDRNLSKFAELTADIAEKAQLVGLLRYETADGAPSGIRAFLKLADKYKVTVSLEGDAIVYTNASSASGHPAGGGNPSGANGDASVWTANLGTKATNIVWSSTGNTFRYGWKAKWAFSYRKLIAAGVECPCFQMSNLDPDKAIAFCCEVGNPRHGAPGVGAHVVLPNASALRLQHRIPYAPPAPKPEAGAGDEDASQEADPAGAADSGKPAGAGGLVSPLQSAIHKNPGRGRSGKGGKGGKGKGGKGKGKPLFRAA